MYRYYKDFCSSSIRILLLIETLLVSGITCVLTMTFGTYFVGTMVGIVFHMIILTMADFMVFGGIGLKKQKLMEYVKSSFYGPEVVRKALYADALVTFLRIAVVGIVPCIFSIITEGFSPVNSVCCIGLIATACVAIAIGLLVSRRFCSTFTMHMLISYLFMAVSSLLFVPLTIMFGAAEKSILIIVIYVIILIVLAIVLLRAMINMCFKGFKSGYSDI